jgi:hypothetical protein
MRNMKHLTHLRGLFAVLWDDIRNCDHIVDSSPGRLRIFLGGGVLVYCHFEAGPRVDSTLMENKLFCYHEQWVTITDWLQ